MRFRYYLLGVLMILNLCLSACSLLGSESVKVDQNQNTVNVIALMPVENRTRDARVQKLLRARLMEELRFKGYLQIAPEVIDSKMKLVAGHADLGSSGLARSKDLLELLGADAAMYCSLQESKASTTLFYSPATVSVKCELRSTRTGETIWDAQSRSTSRSFDVLHSKLKSNGALESALEEVVGKVMETLPYGPKLRG
jgi:hypothetical protein